MIDISLYPRYKELRKFNPEMARKALVEAYFTVNKNISDVARLFKTTKKSVRKAIKRYEL